MKRLRSEERLIPETVLTTVRSLGIDVGSLYIKATALSPEGRPSWRYQSRHVWMKSGTVHANFLSRLPTYTHGPSSLVVRDPIRKKAAGLCCRFDGSKTLAR